MTDQQTRVIALAERLVMKWRERSGRLLRKCDTQMRATGTDTMTTRLWAAEAEGIDDCADDLDTLIREAGRLQLEEPMPNERFMRHHYGASGYVDPDKLDVALRAGYCPTCGGKTPPKPPSLAGEAGQSLTEPAQPQIGAWSKNDPRRIFVGEVMILNTSDEAARFVENVKGWVSRDGRFYGDDERSARWGGATHVPCADCGQPVEKNWIRCEQCREKAEIERHAKRERKPYDGGWVYSETAQEFFEDEDALRDWLDDPDRNYTLESLRLVVCDPVYPHYIDADDLFCDDLPEDCSLRDVAGELDEWIARANECIAGMIKCGSAISWRPGKFAVDVSTLPSDIFARRETPP